MIYITRTIQQTHKSIPTNIDINSEKNFLDNDFDRKDKNIRNLEFKVENELDKYKLENIIRKANSILLMETTKFEFSIHERTNRLMVKLMDNETGEIIKEIPPEKMLDLVGEIWDLVGILVDERG